MKENKNEDLGDQEHRGGYSPAFIGFAIAFGIMASVFAVFEWYTPAGIFGIAMVLCIGLAYAPQLINMGTNHNGGGTRD